MLSKISQKYQRFGNDVSIYNPYSCWSHHRDRLSSQCSAGFYGNHPRSKFGRRYFYRGRYKRISHANRITDSFLCSDSYGNPGYFAVFSILSYSALRYISIIIFFIHKVLLTGCCDVGSMTNLFTDYGFQ